MTGDSSQSRSHAERLPDGRFAAGNTLARGHGNPKARFAQRVALAIAEATTEQQVVDVLDALRTRALDGDSNAATCWLQRVVGPARTVVEVPLPAINTAGDAATAARSVLEHVTSGAASLEEGQRLLELVAHVRDACVLEQLETRVAQLERGGAL
jgi:hypothetical protein